MPSLPLVVIAEARDLAWRCGIDGPSALSLTAEAWADFPDPVWRTVAHHRCVDERRRLSGRNGDDHRPLPVLDEQTRDGGSTVGELIPCEEHGYQAAEDRCDLAALIGDLPDADLAALARRYWLGLPAHPKNSPQAVVEARAMRHARAAQHDPPSVGPMSSREAQILALAADGLTKEAIGRAAGISPNTVKTHMGRIATRLNARSTTHAVAIALRAGWIT